MLINFLCFKVFPNKPEGREEVWKAFKPRSLTCSYLALSAFSLPASLLHSSIYAYPKDFFLKPSCIIRDSGFPCMLCYILERSADSMQIHWIICKRFVYLMAACWIALYFIKKLSPSSPCFLENRSSRFRYAEPSLASGD